VAEVVWTAAAERDLRTIHRYIARDSPYYASVMVRRIRESSGQLARFPESGRVVPESRSRRHREIIVQPYRIVYRFTPDTNMVRIVRVIHGHRLLPRLNGSQTAPESG
jgi:toxin ParE1/3/4